MSHTVVTVAGGAAVSAGACVSHGRYTVDASKVPEHGGHLPQSEMGAARLEGLADLRS